jgi:hypothetical protein
MAPAGPRQTVHRPRPSSARPRVEARSWTSAATGTIVSMEGFYRESTPSPILGQSLTPIRLPPPLPRAVLTPTCASLRVTGKRAGHEEVLPSRDKGLRRTAWPQ